MGGMMKLKSKKLTLLAILSGATVLTACASYSGNGKQAASFDPAQIAAETKAMMMASFTERGIAKVDRLNQDAGNVACSEENEPTAAQTDAIEKANFATIKPPSDGVYMGDWKAGETLAQNGRGSTWSDLATAPNGGNCYNCHQINKAEVSFGTIGPTLNQYGKLRGNSKAVMEYTWGKLYNAKAYNACSGMPRFGHNNLLTQKQMQDLMALLLDPASPVNQ